MGHYASEMDDPPPRNYGMDEWQRKTNDASKGPPDPDSPAAKNAEIARLRAALEMARKRIVYYGTISDRRHFDHDLAEVYPKIDAALAVTNGVGK